MIFVVLLRFGDVDRLADEFVCLFFINLKKRDNGFTTLDLVENMCKSMSCSLVADFRGLPSHQYPLCHYKHNHICYCVCSQLEDIVIQAWKTDTKRLPLDPACIGMRMYEK